MNNNILKLKSDKGGMYVFDAITNNIFNVENAIEFDSITINDLGHSSYKRKMDNITAQQCEFEVFKNAKTLVIELTERCNLRCTYCVFDESSNLDRSHSEKSIDLTYALTMVDAFYKRTSGEIAYIVFYGGEPLLEFGKIKNIVNYANKISNRNIKFSFTTNGVSLSKEKLDFLVENDFLITVSLDGSKDTHNKFRVTKSGKGTFDIILSNLENIKIHNKEYYDSRVQINCVIATVKEISGINHFFEEFRFNPRLLRFSPSIQNQVSINSYIASSIKKAESFHDLKPIEHSYIYDIVKKIEYRELDDRANLGKKVCVPFSNRTYIRVDKSQQFCERIGDFSKVNGDKELSELSYSIISDFNNIKNKDCEVCFAYNFCEMCPASFILDGVIDFNLAKRKCNEYRELVKIAFLIYINEEE